MKSSLFDYQLPKELIAQEPTSPRDACRLMVLDRQHKSIQHSFFYQLDHFLKKGDVLVFNDTKVIPARLWGKAFEEPQSQKGRKIEVLLVEPLSSNRWSCLLGGKKRKVGLKVRFGSFRKQDLEGEIVRRTEEGIWEIQFNHQGKKLHDLIFRLGKTPLPPYIKKFKTKNSKLKADYQTVFAKYEGSIAAPTAGLHFTKRLLAKLKKKGVELEYITLHVGPGTFLPVRVEDIKEHKMPSEWFRIKKETAQRLNQAKKEGRRIIAVGTTTLRALESNTYLSPFPFLKAGAGRTNLFIYPGYKFKFVDGLITNFHLPKSTLLILVCAFASRRFIFQAYQEAIKKRYRFYSFGDAMLIF